MAHKYVIGKHQHDKNDCQYIAIRYGVEKFTYVLTHRFF